MKSNLQEKTHNRVIHEKRITTPIFTLIGMSGCGKTTLSQKLSREGLFHYSIDYEIAHKYMREKIRQSVIEKIKLQSPFFKNLYEQFAIKLDLTLTFDDLAVITMFVIPIAENGRIPLAKFLENQECYKQAELMATQEFFNKASVAFENYDISGFVNDTTGSICEVVLDNPELINLLKERTKVVFLKTDETHKQDLINRSKSKVKPILYNREFFIQNLREYYKMEIFSEEFESKFEFEQEFLFWLFPRLLEFRQKNYQELIAKTDGISIDVSLIKNIENLNDLLYIIQHAND